MANESSVPHHERIADPVFRRAVDLLDAGDVAALRDHLRQYPHLATQRVQFDGDNYFRHPSLLEFIAENPVRHGTLPPNIVEVAKVILDAGADRDAIREALGLVASGRIPRECAVQSALIDLLCDRGADPASALNVAAAHGEFEAVRALLARGASLTLPIAAALGHLQAAREQLGNSGERDRHLALAFAAQFGYTEIVRLLLDAGEDPGRYNPPGSHAQSTPLHQAALAGHESVVHLLVERGARLNVEDLVWHGTPAGWARHAGRMQLAEYLERQSANGGKSPNRTA